jgi:hypothetical protein
MTFFGGLAGMVVLLQPIDTLFPDIKPYQAIYEIFGYRVKLGHVPAVIGAVIGAAVGMILGRGKISVGPMGIHFQGLVRKAHFTWAEIEKIHITLVSAERGPPLPVFRIYLRDKSRSSYNIFLDLPAGPRRRLQAAIEAHGIQVDHNRFMFIAPLQRLVLLGIPILILLTAL